jgi:hypothetical protein
MFEIWLRAITRPMLVTYQQLLEEEPSPSLGTALLWMIVAGVISAVVSGILSFITGFGEFFDLTSLLCGLVAVPIGACIGFLIVSGVYFVAAKVFGGEGMFGRQSYLLAAAYAPMGIISAVLVAIPMVGPWLSLVCSLYTIWLTILALQAAHRFGTGRAIASVLAPLLIIVIPICLITILLLVGPAVGSVFSEIVNEI